MRAKRTDENQRSIVDLFRDLHCSVHVTSSLGGGYPDIVVGFRGRNYLFEIKRSPREKLTACERDFFTHWLGQVARLNSIDDALTFFQEVMLKS